MLETIEVIACTTEGMENLMEKTSRLSRQLPIGTGRLPEVLDVQKVLLAHPPVLTERGLVGIMWSRGILQPDHRPHPLWMSQCQIVDGESTKIQSGKHSLIDIQVIE